MLLFEELINIPTWLFDTLLLIKTLLLEEANKIPMKELFDTLLLVNALLLEQAKLMPMSQFSTGLLLKMLLPEEFK